MHVIKKLLFVFLLFSSAVFAQEYKDIAPGAGVEIPGDFYFRDGYRIQWWYFTGHLFDETGREFGYELTFFVVNVQERSYTSQFGVKRIYISHFAISDIKENRFLFSDQADTDAYALAGAKSDSLKVWAGKNILEGDMTKLHIQAEDREKSLDLSLVPAKPLVLNGENGYSRKSEESPLNASLYFSCSSLETRGTIKIGRDIFRVKGKTWFDREISSRGLSEDQQGWDWFAIQLDDDRELMLYLLRKKRRNDRPLFIRDIRLSRRTIPASLKKRFRSCRAGPLPVAEKSGPVPFFVGNNRAVRKPENQDYPFSSGSGSPCTEHNRAIITGKERVVLREPRRGGRTWR